MHNNYDSIDVKGLLRVRMEEKIEKLGEPYVLNGITLKGLFHDLDADAMRAYLDDPSIARMVGSGVFMVTPADAEVKTGDCLSRIRVGGQYRALKVTVQRVGGSEIAKNVVLVRVPA